MLLQTGTLNLITAKYLQMYLNKRTHEYCPLLTGNLTRGDTANQERFLTYRRGRRPL